MDSAWVWVFVVLGGMLVLLGIAFFGTANIPSPEEAQAELNSGR